MSNGFVHSVKVPRLYKTASKIVRNVRENGGSLKSLIFEQKHPNISAIYSLCLNTLQKEAQLNDLLNQTGLLKKESRLDPWLAKILITELLWGKQVIKTDCKPVQSILKYEKQLREKLNQSSGIGSHSPCNKTVRKPRYVRINTLLISINKAISSFIEEGWLVLPRCSNYMEQLTIVKSLRKPKFIQDFHVPELFIFPPDTAFYDHPAYHNGEIILQDKASCFPAHLLHPKSGSVILDMCAAPGMKSSHVAALIRNQGKVYAVEIDKRRYTTLCEQMKITSSSCVKTLNEDSLTLEGKDYSDVEYILVDPTCSSSGMLVGQLMNDKQCSPQRLKQLQAFQVFLLRHALMNFPNVKKVVYSTCSINPEENEEVVDEVLENVKDAYELVSIKNMYKDNWKNYSSQNYKCSDKCLYARPEVDLCNGFFVAIFERNFNVPLPVYKRKGNKMNNEQLENNGGNENQDMAETSSSRKRKKRGKRKSMNATQNTSLANSNLNTSSDSIKIVAEICNDDEDSERNKDSEENGKKNEESDKNEEKNEDSEGSEETSPPKKVKRKVIRKTKQIQNGIPLKHTRKQVKIQRKKK